MNEKEQPDAEDLITIVKRIDRNMRMFDNEKPFQRKEVMKLNDATWCHCTKCGSNEVVVIDTTPPTAKSIPMDELPAHFGCCISIPAVLRTTNYRATCLACGYVVEWSG